MPIIRIKTRVITATDTEGERITVEFSTGESTTFPFPYSEGPGLAAHEACIRKLLTPELSDQIVSLHKTGETMLGYRFTLITRER